MVLKQKVTNILNFLWSANGSLKTKAIRGSSWLFLAKVITRVLTFIRTLILARLLAPQDFGLMGIAFLLLATLKTFSEFGLREALIQRKEKMGSYLNTFWTSSILRGITLFTFLFLIAPYAANFFNAPRAVLIIQTIGLSALLRSFTSPGITYLEKELEFNKLFFCHLSGTLANFTVAVLAAWKLRSVWALVLGALAASIVELIVSYLIYPWRPKIELNYRKSKELFGFGKWILGSGILVFLITQGDDFFVGKLLGVTALGFYQMAYKISSMPASEISDVISPVVFPAYSKLQEDISKLRNSYLKILQLTAFLSFPIAGLTFALAPDFTRIFLGEKWMPMVDAMRVLAIWSMIRGTAEVSHVAQAVGKPEKGTKVKFIELTVLGSTIYPLTVRWGILGTSLAVALASLIARFTSGYMVIKIIGCKARNFCKRIILPLASTIIMVLSMFFLKALWVTPLKIWGFFISIALGVLIYLGTTYLFDKFLNYRMRFIIYKIFNQLNSKRLNSQNCSL